MYVLQFYVSIMSTVILFKIYSQEWEVLEIHQYRIYAITYWLSRFCLQITQLFDTADCMPKHEFEVNITVW